ncbi:MAG: tyrosine-type recombinase/integrase [Planctomycetes bacterium]|nr:tyrosine-type recombinase/integrase [Planctomycetota bacterium]
MFPSEEGGHMYHNFRRGFEAAIKNAPIGNLGTLTPHVLRHTFISHLLIYGKQDIFTVAKLAGHSSIETTQIYLTLLGGDSQKQSAVDSLPAYGS